MEKRFLIAFGGHLDYDLPRCVLLFCAWCSYLNFVLMYVLYLCTTILYCTLSHALKNTANQRPGFSLHILRYATGSTPLYFPVITCAQQFAGVLLRTSQKPNPKLFNSMFRG